MGKTVIAASDARAVRRWAGAIFTSSMRASFWVKNMMSRDKEDANAPVQIVTDLEQSAGDNVTYTMYAQLGGQPVYGDDVVEGNEASLDGYTDNVSINYVKRPVDVGGQMTRKRTADDLRTIAKDKVKDYLARFIDEACFMTVSGARGVNSDFIVPLGATTAIRDTAAFTPYDSNHIVYSGAATSKATLVSTDKFSLDAIDRAITMAGSEGGGSDGKNKMNPLSHDGEDERYVLSMHKWQEHDLRIAAGTTRWLDIQKAAAAAQGTKNAIFMNSLGEYRNTTLRSHAKAIRFSDYGAGSNVGAGRAVLMGRQALVCAFGDAGMGQKGNWVEKAYDRDNSKLAITGTICLGFKRPQFNGQDISSIAIDSAVTKPY